MRDFAYEQVARGEGIEAMATPLVFNPSSYVSGTAIDDSEVFMKFEEFHGPFVPASALGPAIEAGRKLFTQLSPHGHGDWIECFSLEHLKAIPLCKIKVGKAQKTVDPAPEDVVQEDVERTKKAADHARKLLERSQLGMSGEDFIRHLHESPDIDLARQILRRANAGGAEVTSPSGTILTPIDGKPITEIPCAEVQTVKIKAVPMPAKPGYVYVQVVDSMEHADFWSFFPDRSIELEVVDADDQRCLLLSQYLDEALLAQLNVTVLSPHGRMTREGIQASLSKTLDHRGLAHRVVESLTRQYDFKF